MRAVSAIILPAALILLLHSPPSSSEESIDASNNLAPSLGDVDTVASSSISKRGARSMTRYNRGLHMLRLGKRADDSTSSDNSVFPVQAPVVLDYLLPHGPQLEDGDDKGPVTDLDDELYYPADDEFVDDEGDDESLLQRFQYRPIETDDPSEEAEWEMSKRQNEQNNSAFTDDVEPSVYGDNSVAESELGKRHMSMLRLGKRQMSMLRLGKRQMGMLRLGKRHMGMLRLGKRPMDMLRLGKRPMNMLRLGKRPMNMLRLGKRPMNMLRLGKRPMNMLRLGKRPMDGLRLGKRPMDWLRLGKRPMNMLRLGKRSMSMLQPDLTESKEFADSSAKA
ncbi:hypothetical protein EGW08_012540 [Elysia chlorotica]|uniref:Uncharacterized protein n=1 Tax=Elysia chlorotica TaxID=188477 RepID=A0A3S1A0N5_ELYCH|nr:hypothetical protein EGW08_012540 [Elysia chlorotica]